MSALPFTIMLNLFQHLALRLIRPFQKKAGPRIKSGVTDPFGDLNYRLGKVGNLKRLNCAAIQNA